tara:strand:+ start:138 stop:806 length:669 start_codon:yes stop_codon:yes gene_type:complete
MRPELEQIALVEDFIEGRLSGDALKEFENKMSVDPDFKHEVEMQMVITEAVFYAGRERIGEDLDRAYTNTRPNTSFSWNSSMGYLLGAAIVSSMALGALWLNSEVEANNTVIVQESIDEASKEAQPEDTLVKDNSSIQVVNENAGELNLKIIRDKESGYYSFDNGTLTLYGDYESDKVYVEELFGSGKYYLHYQSDHFLLEANSEKQALVKETDPEILELFQ